MKTKLDEFCAIVSRIGLCLATSYQFSGDLLGVYAGMYECNVVPILAIRVLVYFVKLRV